MNRSHRETSWWDCVKEFSLSFTEGQNPLEEAEAEASCDQALFTNLIFIAGEFCLSTINVLLDI